MPSSPRFDLKILRGTPGEQYWQIFEIENFPFANVISCLMEIAKKPVTKEGKKVTPVAWEQGCLEEVCGSCSMLINGRPRQACTALIDPILTETKSQEIVLAPFSKFPLVRDLVVDRSIMFENLKKVQGWIEVDGAFDRGPGPLIPPKKQEMMYALSSCMTCGCCVEACPQANAKSQFMGPQVVAQVRLFNAHPTGTHRAAERLHVLMGEGGVGDCGKAQNCVKVCPKKIPLTEAIAEMGRQTTMQAFKDIFSTPDKE
jgi:succinate dehydrogenase / fumarate reductase iron-sulfur subunit